MSHLQGDHFSLQGKPYSYQYYVTVIDKISSNLYKIALKTDPTVYKH